MLIEKLLNLKTSKPDTGPRYIQVPRREAGIYVDHDTALQSSAVYACIRVIAEDIASLPWHVYVRRQDGGRDRAAFSPVEKILNSRPNQEMSAFSFRETLTAWALTWGNGYAEIVRDMAGRIAELYPISPDRVEVKRDNSGKIVYEISNARSANSYLEGKDVYHLHGVGFDGLVGYSTVSLAARSIGLSISLEEFGAQFFGNGSQLGGLLEIPNGVLDSNGKANLRDTFNKAHQGPSNAHKVEILDAGITYKEVGVEPNKGQFTESRQNQVEEICRWFRVSPHKVAHLLRMTFNNVEQLSIDHVQGALIPWMTRLEQEADYKLFSTQNTRQYTKISANALLRGDTESRTTFYREMWNLGVLSVNEIRELEDMNPVEDGDKRFVQLNMTTLEKAGEEPEPDQDPQPEPMPDELIEDRVNVLLMKEHNRFIGLKDRYPDRQEYVDRVCGHLGSQRYNVAKEIGAILKSIIHDADQEQLDEAAKIYADLHVENSRKQALLFFDGEPTQDIQDRAKLITRKIKDSALLYMRKYHAVANA